MRISIFCEDFDQLHDLATAQFFGLLVKLLIKNKNSRKPMKPNTQATQKSTQKLTRAVTSIQLVFVFT